MYIAAEAAIDLLWQANAHRSGSAQTLKTNISEPTSPERDASAPARNGRDEPLLPSAQPKRVKNSQSHGPQNLADVSTRRGPRGPLYWDPSVRLYADQHQDKCTARPPSAPSDVQKREQAQESKRTRRTNNTRLRIPQTVVFREGVIAAWYFMSGGAIRRKQKKSLEKSILLRKFITDTKPGRPVALMVCTNRGGDGMMTTCCSVLDEAAFSLLVKNAFSTRMTCMLQEYVVGESKADRAWRVSAVPDPRVDGQGWLEASWSPGCLQVTLRAETELAAVSHQVVESTQADSHAMSRPRIILYPRKDNKVAADAGVSDVAGGGQKKRELEADGLRLHIGISSKADLFDRGRSELFRRFVGDCKHEYARAVRAEGHAFKRYPDVASGRISAPAILLEDKDRRSDTKNSGGRPGHDSNRQHPHPNHDKLMEPRRPQRWQSVYAQHESIAQRVLVREAFGGLDYYQNGLGAVIGLKERQQVMAMCEHMSQLVPRAYVHSNAGDEHPHLRRLLAYFKRSCKGKLYMIWCSMGVHVPSETAQAHARVGRTINSDLAGIRELLQNLVLSPGWYTKYCLLEEDEDKGLIKAFDSRATTMDIYEFVALLVKINLIPTRLSKKHAASVFRKANRDEDAGDSDVFQMNFQEFRVGIRLVAEALGIDNHAMDSAMRFGDVLSNPNAFPRFARAAKDAMQFYEFYTLLLTFRITPFFVSKDAAEQEFRKVVKIEKERAKERGWGGAGAAGAAEDGSASPPAAVNSKNAGGNRIMGLSLEAYREVMMRLAASLSLHLRMDDDGERVCVNSSYSEKILGGSFPPREKRDKLIDRLLKTTSVKGANKADKGPKSDNKSPKNGRDGRPRCGGAVSPAGSPVSPEEPDEASQSPEAAKAAAQNGKQGSPGGRFRQDGPSKDRATGGANLMDKAVTKTQVGTSMGVRLPTMISNPPRLDAGGVKKVHAAPTPAATAAMNRRVKVRRADDEEVAMAAEKAALLMHRQPPA